MSIEGYNLFRKDRDSTEKQKGGGVAIYIKSELDSMRVDELNDVTWEEPLIKLKHYKIDVSLFDLIAQNVKVYILDYDLKGIDIDENTRR